MTGLYVSRRLKNTDAFIKWAKSVGISKVVTPEDLHTTIAYSKAPVDESKRKPDTRSHISMGGKRSVEPLGDQGAIVLFFEDEYLQKSFKELIDIGASWDHDEYKPHITISYEELSMDTTKIIPYEGPLEFYGEVYEPLNEDWKDDVVHESIMTFSEFCDKPS